MNYRSTELYYGSISGMTVKITEVNNRNARSFKVMIITQGGWRNDYYSLPIPEQESFINIENMLQYIKRQTECSENELSIVRSSIK